MAVSKLNSKKKRTFNFFTRSFENSKNDEQLKELSGNSEIKVLITRPNHRLGNQLLLTPLIQEVKKQFPNCKIDLVVNGNLSSILFSDYNYIETIYNLPKKPFNNIFSYITKSISLITKKYDIAIAGCETSNSSKIFVKLSRTRFKIYNSETLKSCKPTHIAQYPVYNLNSFLDTTKDLSNYKYPQLSLQLCSTEIEKGKLLIKELFNNNKKTICIFTFATANKCHCKTWWLEVYNRLKIEFTNFNILEILPIENVSQIDFKSTHFYSKDLREIASLIQNCALFIGADSGMMHLSSCTNTTTLGLFNADRSRMYGPYGDENQSIDTNSITVDDIINIMNSKLHNTI